MVWIKIYQIKQINTKSLLTAYIRREQLRKIKTGIVNLRTVEHITRTFNQDLNQWLALSKEKFGRVNAVTSEFVIVTGIHLNVVITKPSLGANTKYSADLKNKKKSFIIHKE